MKRLLFLIFLIAPPILAQGMKADRNEQLESWKLEIQARIQRAWALGRPASARTGLNCAVYLTQSPEGQVLVRSLGSATLIKPFEDLS
jgi:hypothetical protein